MSTEHATRDGVQQVCFLVPRRLVKKVKTAVENAGKAHPYLKVRALNQDDEEFSGHQSSFLVPSTFTYDDSAAHDFLAKESLGDDITLTTRTAEPLPPAHGTSPLEQVVREWLLCLENIQYLPIDALVRDLPRTYSQYGPLLLLPPTAFQSETWRSLLASLPEIQTTALYAALAARLKTTHIALNAPIPLHNAFPSSASSPKSENIIRTPSNLTPLYGPFGPLLPATHPPTPSDFNQAFWAHTRQTGITQTWAPRYTMFSRGNITEKSRILSLPSVTATAAAGPCTAVDLFAGIGYFAFSYAAAGCSNVLCWDLNPWSVEGLRRGARANGWAVEVYAHAAQTADVDVDVDATSSSSSSSSKPKLLAFVESNAFASSRIEALRARLPPVRHVNCGLLPSSVGCYGTAARALDARAGGWVHVHENFGVGEIEDKAEGVRAVFEGIVAGLDGEREGDGGGKGRREVVLEHVQRVKSYAPGVFHCVLDLYVPPREQG